MIIENLTSVTYFLGSSEFRLSSFETLVVPDNIYSGNPSISNAIDNLFKQGRILVTETTVSLSEILEEENESYD